MDAMISPVMSIVLLLNSISIISIGDTLFILCDTLSVSVTHFLGWVTHEMYKISYKVILFRMEVLKIAIIYHDLSRFYVIYFLLWHTFGVN